MNVGDTAPEFELMNQDKNKVKAVRLSRQEESWCCCFIRWISAPSARRSIARLVRRLDQISDDEDTVVYGVSCDSPFCHEALTVINLQDSLRSAFRHVIAKNGQGLRNVRRRRALQLLGPRHGRYRDKGGKDHALPARRRWATAAKGVGHRRRRRRRAGGRSDRATGKRIR